MAVAHPSFDRPRTRAWAPALVAAAGVHALAWALLQGGGLVGERAPHRVTHRAVGAAVQARLTHSDSALARPHAALALGGAEPAAAPLERVAEPTAPSAAPATTAGGAHLVSAPYWPSEALQVSPRPELGWVLDEDVLDGVRQARMLVQVWVAESGRIDRVQLLEAEPAGPWAEQALSHLGDTLMRPGVKEGRPVASTVVVEIATEVERFR